MLLKYCKKFNLLSLRTVYKLTVNLKNQLCLQIAPDNTFSTASASVHIQQSSVHEHFFTLYTIFCV